MLWVGWLRTGLAKFLEGACLNCLHKSKNYLEFPSEFGEQNRVLESSIYFVNYLIINIYIYIIII